MPSFHSLFLLLSLIAIQALQAFSTDVPVFVMLPLNTVDLNGALHDVNTLHSQLATVKNTAHIDGFVVDVWWGIVERTGPKSYNWTAYQQLAAVARDLSLKVVWIQSFHQCGGNVGDACDISLPPWVLSVGNSNPGIYYTDREGNTNTEYLSLGVDNQALFNGRTAVQLYADFMQSFAANVLASATDVTAQVQIGLGPAGELRYPAYPLSRWSFPGVGEFQCYDKYMLASLAQAAVSAGHADWGHGGPSSAGTYNSQPSGFFADGTTDNYASDYGKFFLGWYFQGLLNHSEAILYQANAAFKSYNVPLAAKVAGIHWLYKTNSHAAELTAGYINVDGFNPYGQIAHVFAQYNVAFDFTCAEMLDTEQPASCNCGPQELVQQTHSAAASAGIPYSAENALERYDTTAYNTIETTARNFGGIERFYYLRLTDTLLQSNNLNTFASFVNTMHNL